MLSPLTRKLLIAVITTVVVLAAGLYLWLQVALDRPLSVPDGGYRLEVERGAALSNLARSLAAEGVISSPYALLVQARLTGGRPIHRGEYMIAAGETMRSLLEKLVSGDVILYQVTFPEGRTYRQWLAVLSDQEPLQPADEAALDEFSRLVAPDNDGNPEGWFFPDTYTYSRGSSPIKILSHAHERMVAELQREWQDRAPGLPYESAYQALIMASIIEKETAVPEERGRIAGVFVRRLQQGMRLQTDPTVIYGLGEAFRGNLTRAHLAQENPYNTYRIKGLPPTPIANPGLAALHAALHPEAGDSLYFVARGDGSHAFSATLAEHERAVRQFQLKRRADYRSDPAGR